MTWNVQERTLQALIHTNRTETLMFTKHLSVIPHLSACKIQWSVEAEVQLLQDAAHQFICSWRNENLACSQTR